MGAENTSFYHSSNKFSHLPTQARQNCQSDSTNNNLKYLECKVFAFTSDESKAIRKICESKLKNDICGFTPIEEYFEQSGSQSCSDQKQFTIYYQKLKHSLKQSISVRISHRYPYNSFDIEQVIRAGSRAIYFMSLLKERSTERVKPQHFVFNQNFEAKLLDTFLVTEFNLLKSRKNRSQFQMKKLQIGAIAEGVSSLENHFYQSIQELNLGENELLDEQNASYMSNLYSLGIVALQMSAISPQFITRIYGKGQNYKKCQINTHAVNKYLSEIKNQKIKTLIKILLDSKPQKRWDILNEVGSGFEKSQINFPKELRLRNCTFKNDEGLMNVGQPTKLSPIHKIYRAESLDGIKEQLPNQVSRPLVNNNITSLQRLSFIQSQSNPQLSSPRSYFPPTPKFLQKKSWESTIHSYENQSMRSIYQPPMQATVSQQFLNNDKRQQKAITFSRSESHLNQKVQSNLTNNMIQSYVSPYFYHSFPSSFDHLENPNQQKMKNNAMKVEQILKPNNIKKNQQKNRQSKIQNTYEPISKNWNANVNEQKSIFIDPIAKSKYNLKKVTQSLAAIDEMFKLQSLNHEKDKNSTLEELLDKSDQSIILENQNREIMEIDDEKKQQFNPNAAENLIFTNQPAFSQQNFDSQSNQNLNQNQNEEEGYSANAAAKQLMSILFQPLPDTIRQVSENSNDDSQVSEFVIEQYEIGSKYQGYKKYGMRNGHGKLFYQQGSYYDGEWRDNKMHGFGRLYYSDNKLAYEGDWYADMFCGYGIVYNDRPTVIEECVDYSNLNQLKDSWKYYQGGLKNDKKQGYGKIMFTNGQVFEGEFHNDKIEGKGAFKRLNGELIVGIWRANIFIKLLNDV